MVSAGRNCSNIKQLAGEPHVRSRSEVFVRDLPDRSGIGSVCLLLGEFSSPNPVYSVLEVCSSVALTVIYSIWSFGAVVNLFVREKIQ